MARRNSPPPRRGLPSPAALIEFLQANPAALGTREIARAFGLGADEQPAIGERLLARLIRRDTGEIDAEIIRRLDTAVSRIVGVFRRTLDGGVIVAADLRDRS